MNRALIAASLVVAAVATTPWPSHAGVHVDINVGLPGPPPVVVAPAPPPVGVVPPPPGAVAVPPRLVLVPGSPVYYAPALPVDVFFYRGLYYRLYRDTWFSAPGYGGPWRYVAYPSVPRPIIAVPPPYHKIPPGQFRKMEARHEGWHGRGYRD